MKLQARKMTTTKGQYTLDPNTFFSWQATLQNLLIPPSFNFNFSGLLPAGGLADGGAVCGAEGGAEGGGGATCGAAGIGTAGALC